MDKYSNVLDGDFSALKEYMKANNITSTEALAVLNYDFTKLSNEKMVELVAYYLPKYLSTSDDIKDADVRDTIVKILEADNDKFVATLTSFVANLTMEQKSAINDFSYFLPLVNDFMKNNTK